MDGYALNPDTELLELFAENVYVSEVYDNAGKQEMFIGHLMEE